MKLTQAQRNVLEAMADVSVKRRGRNAGEIKGLAPAGVYDGRTVASLRKRGLIAWKADTIHGNGYFVTASGRQEIA